MLCASLLALSPCLVPSVSAAQPPRGADTLSPAAVAESLKVLDELRPKLTRAASSAPHWYRTGMVAWALAQRAQAKPPIPGLDWTRLGRQADTSLRVAAQLDPATATYRVAAGRYLLESGMSITRAASYDFFEQAVEAARKHPSRAGLAEAAIEAGRVRWRRYDALVNRRMETQPGTAIRSIMDATAQIGGEGDITGSTPLKVLIDALELNSFPLPPEYSGLNEYREAEALFREAYDADRVSPRAFHQLAMLLADRNRWQELEQLTRERLASIPWDGNGWLALGLAAHRQGKSRDAAAAFDSALTFLGGQDRTRLDRLERILRVNDTGVVNRGSDADRAARRRLYWLFADPLWSRDGNESRVEFLARVVFAELRWTVDEMNVRGADTDRGDIYIRYGPPNLVASFGGDPGQGIAEVATVWAYNTGFAFTFTGAPTFATARIPVSDEAYVAEVRELQPVRWDNIASVRVDSMPTRVARFRAGADSVDVFVAAAPPVDSIRASAGVSGPPRADIWLLAGGTVGVYHDSAALPAAGVRTWTRRLKAGTYVYRIEASAPGGTRAARATSPLVADDEPGGGFALRGEGLSDLVLATEAEPRAGVPAVRRWTDLEIVPATGALPFGGALALAWEAYDLGVRDGNAEYVVTITVQRERSLAGRVATQIAGRVAGVVGVDRTEDRVSMRYDRTVPHAAALADHMTIALQDTPTGSYRLTLEITDKTSGRTFTRTTGFTIVR